MIESFGLRDSSINPVVSFGTLRFRRVKFHTVTNSFKHFFFQESFDNDTEQRYLNGDSHLDKKTQAQYSAVHQEKMRTCLRKKPLKNYDFGHDDLNIPENRKNSKSNKQKTLENFSKGLLPGSGSEDLFLSLFPGPEFLIYFEIKKMATNVQYRISEECLLTRILSR